jgi:hypothetical protein
VNEEAMAHWGLLHQKQTNRSSCKVPVILVIFYFNLNFCERFSKNIDILNLNKIPPVGADVFYVDGQT